MKSIVHILYLTVLFLKISHCVDHKNVLNIQLHESDLCTKSSHNMISDACTSYLTLDKLNIETRHILADISRNTDFFSYYRLILFGKECPFWSNDNGVCGNIACAVNTLDNEEEIPKIWRAEELGKLEGPTAIHPNKQLQRKRSLKSPLDGRLGANVQESCIVENDDYDERDYCVPEDETAGSRENYVSLVDNPERFTGYAGEGARQIWDAIYRENCFSRLSPLQRPAADELGFIIRKQGQDEGLKQSLRTRTGIGIEIEDECLEKRVFYRIISGMHTSISTHICSEYLNQTTGEWGPNVKCFKDRLYGYNDRIGNLYFNYAMVLRAIVKIGPYLREYTFCSHDATQDSITKTKVQSLIKIISAAPQVFDESLMFVNGEGPSLKEDFRKQFRNISRIMDCVGCDKCRLWGKLQIVGYGTALKILFELGNELIDVPKLRRTEIVALFNTLARISSSVETIRYFNRVIEEENRAKHGERNSQQKDRFIVSHHVSEKREIFVKDNEFDEQEREELRRRFLSMNSEISENLNAELRKMWKVTKYVIRSWIQFPLKLWQVLRIEFSRLWNSYIGLPVKPRKWIFKKPNIDEL